MADPEGLRKLAQAATQGEWRQEYQGGSSTILATTEPKRNDRTIPAYAYQEERGYCIAYPFFDLEGDARRDFVCFSHDDAAYIAAASPKNILALLDELDAARGGVEACAQYRKEGETLAECVARNRKEANGLVGILAAERKKVEQAVNRAELFAEDIEAFHICMDGLGAPRELGREKLSMWGRVTSALRAAEAERDALKVDAERYRWLRDKGGVHYYPGGIEPGVMLKRPSLHGDEQFVLLRGTKADAAIDAARTEAEK